MTGPSPGRLTVRQVVGWSVAFLIIVVLVILYFVYGQKVRPVLGSAPSGEVWLASSS